MIHRFLDRCRQGWWRLLASTIPRSTRTQIAHNTRVEQRFRLQGVAVLGVQRDDDSTIVDLLYARSETARVDPISGAEEIVSTGGAGVWALRLPAMFPSLLITSSAGNATDGEFRHHVLPDGACAQELIVSNLHVRSVSGR